MKTADHREDALALRREVLLAVQVALLGEVTPEVRAVTVGWDAEEVRLRVLVDGEPPDDLVESMEAVGTEIIASLPKHKLAVEVTRLDPPASIQGHQLGAWAYVRKER